MEWNFVEVLRKTFWEIIECLVLNLLIVIKWQIHKKWIMSTHEDDDMDHEEINVDDVDSDSRISYGSNGSEIDLDGNNSCYDDSETAIR